MATSAIQPIFLVLGKKSMTAEIKIQMMPPSPTMVSGTSRALRAGQRMASWSQSRID